jgi:lipid-binding SYLF domain-containing protein
MTGECSYTSEEGAAALAARVKGIRVFLKVVKAGLIVGGRRSARRPSKTPSR